MSTHDKLNNKKQEVGGRIKEKVGKAIGNNKMQAKGHSSRTKGNLKQAGEKVKDAL